MHYNSSCINVCNHTITLGSCCNTRITSNPLMLSMVASASEVGGNQPKSTPIAERLRLGYVHV